MPTRSSLLRGASSLVLCAILAGCGEQLESTVQGTVTYQGSPLASAIIDFQNTKQGPNAAGFTDEDGYYSLKTGSTLGLPAGTYQAAVIAPAGSDITKKYRGSAKSGLVYDVAPGKNTIHIELK